MDLERELATSWPDVRPKHLLTGDYIPPKTTGNNEELDRRGPQRPTPRFHHDLRKWLNKQPIEYSEEERRQKEFAAARREVTRQMENWVRGPYEENRQMVDQNRRNAARKLEDLERKEREEEKNICSSFMSFTSFV